MPLVSSHSHVPCVLVWPNWLLLLLFGVEYKQFATTQGNSRNFQVPLRGQVSEAVRLPRSQQQCISLWCLTGTTVGLSLACMGFLVISSLTSAPAFI